MLEVTFNNNVHRYVLSNWLYDAKMKNFTLKYSIESYCAILLTIVFLFKQKYYSIF